MTQDDENRAAEARNLSENETLKWAIDSLISQAKDVLADIDPREAEAIMAVQADIRSLRNLMGSLRNIILAGTPQRKLPDGQSHVA